IAVILPGDEELGLALVAAGVDVTEDTSSAGGDEVSERRLPLAGHDRAAFTHLLPGQLRAGERLAGPDPAGVERRIGQARGGGESECRRIPGRCEDVREAILQEIRSYQGV